MRAPPMSTATLPTPEQRRPPRAASAQGHRQFLRSQSNPQQPFRSASHPHPSRQYEKELILKHVEAVENKEVLPQEQIALDPANKKLGHSSPHLRLSDFELMRTLGTGTDKSPHKYAPKLTKTRYICSSMAVPFCQPSTRRPEQDLCSEGSEEG